MVLITVVVKGSSGSPAPIADCESAGTVAALKHQIEQALHVPVAEQRLNIMLRIFAIYSLICVHGVTPAGLVFSGHVLADERSLESYAITDGGTSPTCALELFQRMRLLF